LNEAALRKDREMKNPLDQFRSGLFGSRGCDIEAALQYVDELAAASSDAVAVQTAARVLLNTAANAVHQVLNAPSPERLALIELIDQRIDDHKLIREDAVANQITDWMNDHLEEYIGDNIDIDSKISDWMSDNFDVNDYNVDDVVDDKIKEWASDNLADEVEKVIKNSLTFSVQVN
jgi:hypothetical protein